MDRIDKLKDLYTENKDFRTYVDKYCTKHGLSVGEALEHALVREVAAQYLEKTQEKTISSSSYMPMGECV